MADSFVADTDVEDSSSFVSEDEYRPQLLKKLSELEPPEIIAYAHNNPAEKAIAREAYEAADNRPMTMRRAVQLPIRYAGAAIESVKDIGTGLGNVAQNTLMIDPKLSARIAGGVAGVLNPLAGPMVSSKANEIAATVDDEVNKERAKTQAFVSGQVLERNTSDFLNSIFGKESLLGQKAEGQVGYQDPKGRSGRRFDDLLDRYGKMQTLEAGVPLDTGVVASAMEKTTGVKPSEAIMSGPEIEKEFGPGTGTDPNVIRTMGSVGDLEDLLPLGIGRSVQPLSKSVGLGMQAVGKTLKAPAAVIQAARTNLIPPALNRALGGKAGRLTATVASAPSQTAKLFGHLIDTAGAKIVNPKTISKAEREAAQELIDFNTSGKGNRFLSVKQNKAAAERAVTGVLGGMGTATAGMVPLAAVSANTPEEAAELMGGSAGFGGMAGTVNPFKGFTQENIAAVDTILRENGQADYGHALDQAHRAFMDSLPPEQREGVDAYRGYFRDFKVNGSDAKIFAMSQAEFVKEVMKRNPGMTADQAANMAGFAGKDGVVLINGESGEVGATLGHEAGGHLVADHILKTMAPHMIADMRKAAEKNLVDANGKPTAKLKAFIDSYNKQAGSTIIQDNDQAITEYLAEQASNELSGQGPAKYAAGRALRQEIGDNLADYFHQFFGTKQAFDRTQVPELARGYRDLLFDLGRLKGGGVPPSTSGAPPAPGGGSPPSTFAPPPGYTPPGATPQATPPAATPSAAAPGPQAAPAAVTPQAAPVAPAAATPAAVEPAPVTPESRLAALGVNQKQHDELKKQFEDEAFGELPAKAISSDKKILAANKKIGAEADARLESYYAALEAEGVTHPQDMSLTQAMRLHELTAEQGGIPKYGRWKERQGAAAPAEKPASVPETPNAGPVTPEASGAATGAASPPTEAPETPSTPAIAPVQGASPATQVKIKRALAKAGTDKAKRIAALKELLMPGETLNRQDPARIELLKELGYSAAHTKALDDLQDSLGKGLYLRDYKSAPGEVVTSGLDRLRSYKESPAGKTPGERDGEFTLQDKGFTPYRVHVGKDSVYVSGFDHDKFFSNLADVFQAAEAADGAKHGFEGLTGTKLDAAIADAFTKISKNHANNRQGNGNPLPHSARSPKGKSDPSFKGEKVDQDRVNSINMAMNIRGEIEANDLRGLLESEGFDTDTQLKPTISNIRPDFIKSGVHPASETGATVHAHGLDSVPAELTKGGTPHAVPTRAGFRPISGDEASTDADPDTLRLSPDDTREEFLQKNDLSDVEPKNASSYPTKMQKGDLSDVQPKGEPAADQKYFKGIEDAPINEGIEAAEENYHGGIADLGDATAARDVQAMDGYFDYRSHLEEAARNSLGDSFTVYRSLTPDQLEAWKAGEDIGPISVTTNKSLADNWKNVAANKKADRTVVEFKVTPEDIVMRGRAEESEMVIDGNNISAGDVRESAAKPKEKGLEGFQPKTGEAELAEIEKEISSLFYKRPRNEERIAELRTRQNEILAEQRKEIETERAAKVKEPGGEESVPKSIGRDVIPGHRIVAHWSPVEGLKEIDPGFHGKGRIGAERIRRDKFPERYVDRSYVGYGNYVQESGLGKNRYVSEVDFEKMYDYANDPDKLYAKAEAEAGDDPTIGRTATEYERQIKDAGYIGYFNDQHQIAAVFDKLKVEGFRPKSEKSEARKAKEREFSRKFFGRNLGGKLSEMKAEGEGDLNLLKNLSKQKTPESVDTDADYDLYEKQRENYEADEEGDLSGFRPKSEESTKELSAKELLSKVRSNATQGFTDDADRAEGTAFEAAKAVLRASPGAGKEAEAGSREERVSSEKRAVAEWAKAEGLAFRNLPRNFDLNSDENVGGMEHDVWFDDKSQSWIKLTKPSFGMTPIVGKSGKLGLASSSPAQYIERMDGLRELFGLDTKLQAVHLDKRDNPSFLVSQPHIKGVEPTEAEIAKHFENAGFKLVDDEVAIFYRPEDNMAVFDAHPGNLLKTEKGVTGFDVIAIHPEGEVKAALQKQYDASTSTSGAKGKDFMEAARSAMAKKSDLSGFRPKSGSKQSELEALDNKFRISTRKPWAVDAAEDHNKGDLSVGIEPILKDPKLLQKVVDKFNEHGLFDKVMTEKDPAKALEQLVEHAKENLLWLHDEFKPKIRARAKEWYNGARKITEELAKEYNIPRESVAAVMAALSPQKDWFMNVSLGKRVIDINAKQQNSMVDPKMEKTADRLQKKFENDMVKKKAKDLAEGNVLPDSRYIATPIAKKIKDMKGKKFSELPMKDKALWLRVYDEAHNDRAHQIVTPEGNYGPNAKTDSGNDKKTAWGDFGVIAKALGAIENPDINNISEMMGENHKVRNFFNNILVPNGKYGDVTIDTHAVAAALLMALAGSDKLVKENFGGISHAESGTVGLYGVYAEAYRRAAEERGVLPREMQSITWEAVRGLFTKEFKQQKENKKLINDVWKQHAKGGFTLEEARAEILKLAGGIDAPDWAGESSGGTPQGDGNAGNQGKLSAVGVHGGGTRRAGRGGRAAAAGKLADFE